MRTTLWKHLITLFGQIVFYLYFVQPASEAFGQTAQDLYVADLLYKICIHVMLTFVYIGH